MWRMLLICLLLPFGVVVNAASYTWTDGERTYTIEEVPDMQLDVTERGIEIVEKPLPAQEPQEPQRAAPIPNGPNPPLASDFQRSPGNLYGASAQSDSPNASPVFRDSSGQLRALPGGVLIIFHKHVQQSDIADFWQVHGINPDRVARVEAINNLYKIETSAGMESLNLANELANNPQVEYITPNWWKELAVR